MEQQLGLSKSFQSLDDFPYKVGVTSPKISAKSLEFLENVRGKCKQECVCSRNLLTPTWH